MRTDATQADRTAAAPAANSQPPPARGGTAARHPWTYWKTPGTRPPPAWSAIARPSEPTGPTADHPASAPGATAGRSKAATPNCPGPRRTWVPLHPKPSHLVASRIARRRPRRRPHRPPRNLTQAPGFPRSPWPAPRPGIQGRRTSCLSACRMEWKVLIAPTADGRDRSVGSAARADPGARPRAVAVFSRRQNARGPTGSLR
jgi:hypothetical protein